MSASERYKEEIKYLNNLIKMITKHNIYGKRKSELRSNSK